MRLAVRDGYPGRGLPVGLAEPGARRTSGRGLLLCAALASSWGVEYDRTRRVAAALADPRDPPDEAAIGGPTARLAVAVACGAVGLGGSGTV